uniref:Cleavage and polyadenylation specific factor 7 n=1 Tax=Ficedula albicollis TaxID=59894 RepID=A0A803WCX7_FICAL
MSEGVDLIDIYADEEFTQDPEFSNADQMDLYDDVLAASSQPQEKRSSSSEAPPEIRQEPSPKPNSKPPAILYTYSGLRNKRAAVYVGSFSWVSAPAWEIWDSQGTSEGLLGSLEEWQEF